MKHRKQMFMILLAIFLIFGLTALAATDATQKDTKSISKNTDETYSNTLNKDTITATKVSAQNDIDNTKIIETKKNKTIKKTNSTKNVKSSYTKNVKNYQELLNAVDEAKTSTTDKYIINLSNGTYTATANMTWNPTGNCHTLEINGNNNTLNGNNNYYFMSIRTNNILILNDIIISNFRRNGNGGAIINEGSLTITNATFTNNHAVMGGGAIYNSQSTLNVKNSKFTNNYAGIGGGAIYNYKSIINVTHTTFTDNKVEYVYDYGGGAIYNNGNMGIVNSSFFRNDAEFGGAINNKGTLNVNNTNFTNNNAQEGGAIHNIKPGMINIYNSTLNNNTASLGGAIYNLANISINNTKFLNNKATSEIRGGGAICSYNGTINITYSHFEKNYATKFGGAIHINESNMHITHTNFINNTALYAGAINNEGNMSIIKSNLTYNKADYAGAINTTGNLNITETKLDNNKVGVGGGAIYNVFGNLTIKHSQINNNDAPNHGGAIRSQAGTMQVTNTTLNNNTSTYGGAINMFHSPLLLYNCSLNNNNGTRGGAVWTNNNINITKNIFTNNTARYGSAIYNIGDGTITNNTFKTNEANTSGTAIINYGTAEIRDNINDETSIYSSTIHTNSTNVKILKNIFDDGILNTTITISTNNNPKVNDKLNITILLLDQADKTIPDQIINITINDEKYNKTTNQDGTATIEYIPTSNQTLTITATYHGNEKYNNTTTEVNITVDKSTARITAILNNGTPSQASTNITLTDEKGNPIKEAPIIVTDNDQKQVGNGSTDSNGKTNIQLHLPEGTQNLTITYPGNTSYNMANTTQSITITKHTPTINVTDDKKGTIIINVTDEDNKPLPGLPIQVIDENNTQLGEATTDNNGTTSIKIILEPGKYNITIKTPGDEDTKASNITIPLTIPLKDSKMDVKVHNGTQTSVEVKLTDEKGNPIKEAPITVTDNDQKQVGNGSTDSNGKANIALNIPIGTQSITITYPGNTTYKPASNTTTVTKDKHQPTIEATIDQKGTIKINITDETGTPIPGIPVKIADETGKQIANGSTGPDGTVEIPTKLEPGKHNITITTPEDKDNKASNKTITATIPPKDTKIDITVTDPIKGNTTIKVDLKDNEEKAISNAPITVTLPNNTTIPAKTGTDGTIEIALNLPVGNNQIKVDYTGNATYNPTSKNITVNVEKTPTTTTITILNNTAGNVRVTGTVKDKYGQNVAEGTVTIKEGNNNIGTGTLNNGTYTITTTIGSKGTYKLEAQYAETNNYLPSNSQTTTDVVAQTPNMTTKIEGNNVGNTTVTATLKDPQGKAISNAPITVTLPNGTQVTGKTNNNGTAQIPVDLRAGNNNITITYPGNGTYNPVTQKINKTVNKNTPVIKLDPVKGVIGEKITLTAYLTDKDGTPINGGNLAFKLNGKTLRSDGRFDSNAPAMKFNVKDGKVTYTINADLYLRNTKNLTASYSGNYKYEETPSPTVEAQIQKRYAGVTLSVTPTWNKQYDTIKFTATVRDTTKNGKNNSLINQNTKVMFKVNGVTLKDKDGKTLYVPVNANKQAIYNYVIPAGTGGITASKAVRDYKVEAIFVGENYYPGARNISKFNVERSATYVNITQVKVTSSNVLSVKATLKDFKGNNLIGTNKVTVKINGKSYIDPKNGKPKYWSVKNGVVDLTGITVDPKTTIKRVMLVTGERQAYTEGRAETTNIISA